MGQAHGEPDLQARARRLSSARPERCRSPVRGLSECLKCLNYPTTVVASTQRALTRCSDPTKRRRHTIQTLLLLCNEAVVAVDARLDMLVERRTWHTNGTFCLILGFLALLSRFLCISFLGLDSGTIKTSNLAMYSCAAVM